jgi:hypothetical protein
VSWVRASYCSGRVTWRRRFTRLKAVGCASSAVPSMTIWSSCMPAETSSLPKPRCLPTLITAMPSPRRRPFGAPNLLPRPDLIKVYPNPARRAELLDVSSCSSAITRRDDRLGRDEPRQ